MKETKGLYGLVSDMLDERIARYTGGAQSGILQSITGVNTYSDRKLNEITNELSKLFVSQSELRELSGKVDDLGSAIEYMVNEVIVSGLDVAAEVPSSTNVTITAGYGGKRGRPCRLDTDKIVEVPLNSSTSIFYITLRSYGQINVRLSKVDDELTLAKIVVPQPGITSMIQDDKDDKDDSYNAYIISAKDMYFDEDQVFDDASRGVLRDAIGDILAENIYGTITLNENLKLVNTQGTLEINSQELLIKDTGGHTLSRFDKDGIYIFDADGFERAHFTGDDARIGNILIKPDSIQSQDFISGTSGFRISDNGDVEFDDAILRGTIYATAGEIGGWLIASNRISSGDLILDSTTNSIHTNDYVSGNLGSGWSITETLAEFQNIRARGKISTSIFEKEAISVLGGNFVVRKGDILDSDMTASGITLTISGDETFNAGEILRFKDGQEDEWLEIISAASAPTYTVNRDKLGTYDTNPAWKKGTAVVNYGGTGSGGIFMTSSEETSPYINFYTHSGAPYTKIYNKCRIGRLDGIPGASGYGIWGGDGYLGELEVIDRISIGASGAIRSNLIGSYPYLEFSQDGLQLKDSSPGGTYSTAQYGTDMYGFGALAWIFNASIKVPFAVLKEPNAGAADVADIRLYNRSDDPGGKAEIGDVCCVGGVLKICTSAGTPGIWQKVGLQS